jgi:digeranylgeranylglycerophospholipid reductase
MVGNGIIGVGDAVNQANPIHGGGIAESIKATRIAGDVISKAVKSGDVSSRALSEYNTRWWEERGKELDKVQKVREFFEKLSDDEMNDLADALSGEDLSALAHGKGLAKVVKIYLRFKAKGLKRKLGGGF